MKKLLSIRVFLFFLLLSFSATSQIPPGYYDSAWGLTGTPLKVALHNIIKNHTVITYSPGLWSAFYTTDVKPDGKVWDIYSDIPGGIAPYEFTFGTDQCGSYNAEDSCYNREHSFPESWFNGASPMYTDLFHIYPTDGWVNNKRGDYPYGDVGTATWTSLNGSKLGTCSDPGYSGTVFEPLDSFKGDIARSYFYMAVRYYTEDSGWPGSAMVSGAQFLPWAESVLLQWNALDPVSQKEINRNNTIYYSFQHNRNPFIDHPEWAASLWGPTASVGNINALDGFIKIFPVPVTSQLTIRCDNAAIHLKTASLYSLEGKLLLDENLNNQVGAETSISTVDLSSGIYILKVISEEGITIKKVSVQNPL